MVLYIILTRNIINIGGAEIYTRNKYVFLKDKYNVSIISTNKGTIHINELKQFSNSIVEELEVDPFFYSSKQRYKILGKIKKVLPLDKEYEDIIIESQTVQLSLWGELLAKLINARCFCLLTEDRFPRLTSSSCDFFKFKLFRNELAGIAAESLPMLFKNNYEIPSDKCNKLSFICTNSIEDIPSPFVIDRNGFDVVLGTITRLEKICVPFILDEILLFAKNNPNKRILFVFFGGSQNKRLEKQILAKMSIYKNLKFLLTGIIFPVPLSEVQKIDLFINVAGAANATRKKAIPTLVVELETGKPLGFLGVNTNASQYKTESNSYMDNSISNILEHIYIKRTYSLEDIKAKLNIINSNIDFSSHESFIDSSIKLNPKDYYDFSKYVVSCKWKIIISILYEIFGIRFLKFTMKVYRIFFRNQ